MTTVNSVVPVVSRPMETFSKRVQNECITVLPGYVCCASASLCRNASYPPVPLPNTGDYLG